MLMLALAVTGAMMLTACGGNGDTGSDATSTEAKVEKDSPSAAMEKVTKKLIKNDWEGAVSMLYGAEEATEEEKAFLMGLMEAAYTEVGGLDKYEVLSEEIAADGQTAVVKGRYTYKDGTSKETKDNLKITDKGWRCTL